jgi:arabinofuranosyltransferase
VDLVDARLFYVSKEAAGDRLERILRNYLVGSGCFLLIAALIARLHVQASFAVDDGFIVLRYATHFLDGQGLVYNLGERVEGFSSPLWIALLAAVGGLARLVRGAEPGQLELLNRALGIGAAAGCVVATFLLARRRFALPFVYQVGSAVALLFSWPLIFWSGAGLETPLFALLLLLTAHRLLSETPFVGGRRFMTVLLLTAVALCRPEGPLFVVTAGAASWMSAPREQRRSALVALACFGLLYTVLVAARFAYYGALFPNTFHTKVGGEPLLLLLRASVYLYDYWVRGGGAVLCLLALVGLGTWHAAPTDPRAQHARTHLPAFALLLTAIGFIFAVGGDGLYCFRFVVHLLPLVCAYAARGAHVLEVRASALPSVAPRARWIGGALLGAAAYLAYEPFDLDERVLRSARNVLIWEAEENWLKLGRALGQCLPPSSLLATNIAGKVPYASRLPTLDLLGLTDAVIANTKVEKMGRGYAGHEKANVAYVAKRRPAVLFISVLAYAPLDVLQNAEASSQLLARTVLRGYAPLLSQADFEQSYLPALVPLSPRGTVPVYLRRDVAARQRDAECLRVLDWQ